MALGLESVVSQQDFLGCSWKDLQPLGGDGVVRSYGYGDFRERGYDGAENFTVNCDHSPNSTARGLTSGGGSCPMEPPAATRGRRKRRKTETVKNRAEMEKQRMTHIAVERNRRKQMNDYLALLRSMMPSSYSQRGDQASIVGGTIDFVKELEQILQCLEAEKQTRLATDPTQYVFSTFVSSAHRNSVTSPSNQNMNTVAESRSAVANVEVTMMESYANIKMMAENRPKQLLKMVAEMHSLGLVILHINVTTVSQMVLYCFSVKIEDDCKLRTVNEMTAAVYEMFGRIRGMVD